MNPHRPVLTPRRVLAAVLAVFVLTPLIFLWATAPSDPVCRGARFSEHLVARYGSQARLGPRGGPEPTQFREVLKELGPRSAPVLRAWLLKNDSELRERLLALLRRAGLSSRALAIDQNEVAARVMWDHPEFASHWVGAVTEKILEGDERGSRRAAVLLIYLFNSVPESTKTEMASAIRGFPEELLRRFEATGQDMYVLSVLQHIYRWDPPKEREAVLARVSALAQKSRYLDTAVAVLKASGRSEEINPKAVQ